MSTLATLRRAGAAAVLTALATPAVAAAHPGVFEVQAQVVRPGAPTPPTTADLIAQRQYTVLNDGYVIALRESNGVTDAVGGGLLNYKLLPGGVRANAAEFPDKGSWLAYAPARTDLQAHATCLNVPALGSTANILAWQSDPFYRYIPWQKTSAGIADDPARWIAVAKTATGVDLAALDTVEQFTSACSGLGGTYAPADTVITTPTSASSASIADAVRPVTAARDAALAEAAAQTARAAAAEAARATAAAELTRLQLAAAPLRVTLTAPPALATLGTTGVPVSVSAGPLQAITVRLLTTAAKARALGLRSRVLGVTTGTTTAAGVAALTVKATPAAAKAVAATKALALSVEALSGQRSAGLTSIVRRG